MELSKMFGVGRDVEFEVKGYGVSTFKVSLNDDGIECLMIKICSGEWGLALLGTVLRVISLAPDGVIHLPPTLTDEQREQLKALYTLGYRSLLKDKYGSVCAYEMKPYEKTLDTWLYEDGNLYICSTKPTKCLESLVSWSDPEPFDIGKALGVKK